MVVHKCRVGDVEPATFERVDGTARLRSVVSPPAPLYLDCDYRGGLPAIGVRAV